MGFATSLALASAALHVSWNLLLKLAPPEDRDLTSWGLFAFGGVLALPLAVVIAMAAGLIIGAPTLRLRSAC